MTKPLVSVVIPVYNVKDYLDACVESVVNQTLKNIEIILVDDGSTDGSSELCDVWKNRDERIKVIHKENGGLSDARNKGVEVAEAKYVGFVDSDDTIDFKMYEELYTKLIDNGADFSYCGMLEINKDKKFNVYSEKTGVHIYNKTELLKKTLTSNNSTMHSVTKLYNREILLRHPFPVGKTYEDAHFIIGYMLECEKTVAIMNSYYNYLRREGSITLVPYSKKDLSVLEAHRNNYNLLKDYPELKEESTYRLYWSSFYVLDKMVTTDNFDDFENKEKIIKFLKSNYVSIMKNKYVKPGRKLAMTALMLSEKLYALALRSK